MGSNSGKVKCIANEYNEVTFRARERSMTTKNHFCIVAGLDHMNSQ